MNACIILIFATAISFAACAVLGAANGRDNPGSLSTTKPGAGN